MAAPRHCSFIFIKVFPTFKYKHGKIFPCCHHCIYLRSGLSLWTNVNNRATTMQYHKYHLACNSLMSLIEPFKSNWTHWFFFKSSLKDTFVYSNTLFYIWYGFFFSWFSMIFECLKEKSSFVFPQFYCLAIWHVQDETFLCCCIGPEQDCMLLNKCFKIPNLSF